MRKFAWFIVGWYLIIPASTYYFPQIGVDREAAIIGSLILPVFIAGFWTLYRMVYERDTNETI